MVIVVACPVPEDELTELFDEKEFTQNRCPVIQAEELNLVGTSDFAILVEFEEVILEVIGQEDARVSALGTTA